MILFKLNLIKNYVGKTKNGYCFFSYVLVEEINTPAWSIKGKGTENHFIAEISRYKQGCYIVKLLLKEELSYRPFLPIALDQGHTV